MLWENLREEEFEDAVKASNGVCILPIGCIEKHGQHLPLGTDMFICNDISRMAAEKEPAVVFPGMYFGEKSGAGEFKGTIIFSAELRLQILKESCKEIARNGFKKILIVNGHGGNADMLGYFARSVLYEKNDYMVFYCGAGIFGPNNIPKFGYDSLYTEEDKSTVQSYIDSGKRDGHGGFWETSLVYANHPDLVRVDLMDKESGLNIHRFDDFEKYRIGTPFAWMANFPNSYAGYYHPGLTPTIAEAAFNTSVDILVERIKFLKEETISDEYHAEWLAKQK